MEMKDKLRRSHSGSSGLPGLRDVCRRRIIDEMIYTVGSYLEAPAKGHDGGTVVSTMPWMRHDVARQRCIVMFVDASTLRVLSSSCRHRDILEEGVFLVQEIDSVREPFPDLDALYFLSPCESSIEQLLADLRDVSCRRYRSVHVFFSHALHSDLFSAVASEASAVAQIQSFAELNLDFLARDERSFHFDNPAELPPLLKATKQDSSGLLITAERIVSLCATLFVWPCIRYATGTSESNNACERLAQEVAARLMRLYSRLDADRALENKCTLLLVGRDIDWATTLAHDMTYEAMIMDVLGGNSVDVESNTFEYKVDGGDGKRTVVLGSTSDHIWEGFRHQHLSVVNDAVSQEIKDFQSKNATARRQSVGKKDNITAEQSLKALQQLPEYQERVSQYGVHAEICNQCFAHLKSQKLVAISDLEQTLATGLDMEYRQTSPSSKQIMQFLLNDEIRSEIKLRLLLLYFTSVDRLTESQREYLVRSANLSREERAAILHFDWSSISSSQRRTRGDRTPKRLSGSSHTRSWGTLPSTPKPLPATPSYASRYEPQLRRVVEKAVDGSLSEVEYSCIPDGSGWDSSLLTASVGRARVIVFILGGVTLTETRIGFEVSESMSADVTIGGSCLLTPGKLIDLAKKAATS